jgi:hypothetical protein
MLLLMSASLSTNSANAYGLASSDFVVGTTVPIAGISVIRRPASLFGIKFGHHHRDGGSVWWRGWLAPRPPAFDSANAYELASSDFVMGIAAPVK